MVSGEYQIDYSGHTFTERTQFISVANHASITRELHWHTTKFNSDHLLFLLYMNELHKYLKNCKAYLFADGTNLNATSKYLQTIAKKLYNDLKKSIPL